MSSQINLNLRNYIGYKKRFILLVLFMVFFCVLSVKSVFADVIMDLGTAQGIFGTADKSGNITPGTAGKSMQDVTGGFSKSTSVTDLNGTNVTFTTTPTGYVLCNIVFLMMGTTGKGLTVLAIVAIGIEMLYGKMSWTRALLVGVGISIVFGATYLVPNISEYASGCDFG